MSKTNTRTLQQILSSQCPVSELNLKAGDYVFATKFKDASPNDRWRVDIVETVENTSVKFKETGVIPFMFAQIITDEEAAIIIGLLPAMEGKPYPATEPKEQGETVEMYSLAVFIQRNCAKACDNTLRPSLNILQLDINKLLKEWKAQRTK